MTEESGWPLERTAAEAYEQYIVPAWMGEWAQALVESAGVRPGERVLDVACGTGIVARKAAHMMGSGGIVSGLDADGKMLRAARMFARREGTGVIEWCQGDATRIPFQRATFDVVFCQQGLQFFPHRLLALQEMSRVIAPGGRLAVSVWRSLDRCPFLAVLSDVIGRYLGARSMAGFYASCSLSDRVELQRLLTDAGFRNINIRLEVRMARFPSLDEFLPGYISVFPFASDLAAMSRGDQKQMFTELKEALQVYTDSEGLAAPMECHIATAELPYRPSAVL